MLIAKHIYASRFLRTLVFFLSAGLTAQSAANECLDLMPYDTVADGLPKVCQSSFNGVSSDYSCQNYRSGEIRYQVLYRGGLSPRAIIQLNSDGSQQLLSSPLFGDRRLRCPLNPPAGIPEYAVHRGIGVCHDDNDSLVACSVFEHAMARQPEVHRFMTFYVSDGELPVTIDAQIAGINNDAMVAEFAFQLGMSMWETECCAEQAVDYLAYAYRLFPRTAAYREAYRHSRAVLAIQELNVKEADL